MADIVKMPKMSDTMTEGVMAKWHKKVGDKVKSGDVLAEVETDKATMDLESYWDGTLLFVGVEEGKAVPVDAVIAVIGKEGEDYKAALEAEGGAAKADAPKAEEAPKEEAKAPAQGGGLSEEELSKKGVTVIRMPLLSDTMTEGVIAEWHKKVGDKVKDDDVLADVETDKATMEVMGYATGTLLHIGVNKGEAAKVNGIIAIVGPEGTDISAILAQGDAPAKAASSAPAEGPKAEAAKEEAKPQVAANANTGRIIASPLAKKIAKEKGIDLAQVAGSADGGRIIKKDIENFKPAAAAPVTTAAPAAEKVAPAIPSFVGEEKFSERPVTQMRKAISRRLSESLFTAPHFYVTMSIDMDQAIAARTKMNEYAPVKISFNDLVLKAVAIALKQHPAINSSFLGDTIRTNEHVHIGVAVAVDEGLLVPVIRFADGKSLSHISAEVKEYAQKAKSKKLQPAEMEGSTFTISNLGMFGVDEFTAIINTPNACILAVSGIAQVPVVKNGAVVPGNVMKVTLSCDHRVVDGATGAAFLQTLKALLEEPVRLLV
ncbi:dihydrolipoamide acetyltransferase family protein [Pedobacter sp. Hv1]|uniref:dihydrolipoamide acetyltransferase family protein n=1 Tax=Pedobacter sp. Hv1 TaxID=1740090 RepID=UPI0006D8B83B|nr:dihydrolipoamide acetyltransferase family protein [Pedobacter sp. Hv1]KQB99356.1 pyruvate dehydrogenase [Pedobacter sp. Hv1]